MVSTVRGNTGSKPTRESLKTCVFLDFYLIELTGTREPLMWYFAEMFVTTFVLAATLLVANSPSSGWRAESQQSPRKAKASTQAVLVTKGQVENGVYKNDSIGLQFTPAGNLHLQAPEIMGTPGTVPLLVKVEADADRTLISGLFSAPGLTIFYADALAFYPEDQRNATRYLKKVSQTNEAEGYQHVDAKGPVEISGVSFVRADFAKSGVHEAVLVTTHNQFAFVFIFAGPDIGVVNKLVESTNVKFIPQK